MNTKALTLGMIFSAAILAPAAAHHSFAMFDADKTVTMKGTVKELEWTNPHSWLRIMVVDQAGKTVQWGLEMGPPARQIQRGWKPDSLKPGDKVALEIHPLRDGTRGGTLLLITLPDGTKLGHGGQRGDPRGNN